jgi:hypothetical protein
MRVVYLHAGHLKQHVTCSTAATLLYHNLESTMILLLLLLLLLLPLPLPMQSAASCHWPHLALPEDPQERVSLLQRPGTQVMNRDVNSIWMTIVG